MQLLTKFIISCYKFVKVLVVQEKHCSPAIHGLWKIPTGFVLQVFDFAASPNFLNALEIIEMVLSFALTYILYSKLNSFPLI